MTLIVPPVVSSITSALAASTLKVFPVILPINLISTFPVVVIVPPAIFERFKINASPEVVEAFAAFVKSLKLVK